MAGTKHYPAFRGIRNDIAPERFSEDDLVDGINIDLDDAGRPVMRDGSTRVYTGSVHSLWAPASGDPCLFVEGTALKKLASSFATATTIATDMNASARVSYAEHNGLVYLCNGFDSLIVEDGAARQWGVDPPTVTAVAAGGNLPGGRYLFTATYLYAGGRESGALAPQIIDIDGGGITFTIPDSADPQVVGKIVYCSSHNGDTVYEVGMTTGSTMHFGDSSLRLQRPLTTMHYGKPPIGTEVAIYRGRAYVAVGNLVFYSAPFGLELFKLNEYFALPSRVTMIAPAEDGLFIGTERETAWYSGADPEGMTVVQRHDTGAIEGTVTRIPIGNLKGLSGEFDVPVWLSEEGICAGLPGGQLMNLSEQWRFTPPSSGASLFRQKSNDGNQVIVAFNGA